MARAGHLHRLTRPAEFAAVLAGCCGSSGRCFRVQGIPSRASVARLGIVAARRAITRAVDRNRCKRLVRETFRAVQSALGAVDVIVFCRRPVPRGDSGTARAELERLLALLARQVHASGRSVDASEAGDRRT